MVTFKDMTVTFWCEHLLYEAQFVKCFCCTHSIDSWALNFVHVNGWLPTRFPYIAKGMSLGISFSVETG